MDGESFTLNLVCRIVNVTLKNAVFFTCCCFMYYHYQQDLKYENKRTISFQRRYKRSFTRCVLHFIKITRNNFIRNKFKLIHTLNKVSHNVFKIKVDFLKVQQLPWKTKTTKYAMSKHNKNTPNKRKLSSCISYQANHFRSGEVGDTKSLISWATQ